MLIRGSTVDVSDYSQFFTMACWVTCGISLLCVALSWRYFALRCPDPVIAVAAEATA
jgi:hypothetical protein